MADVGGLAPALAASRKGFSIRRTKRAEAAPDWALTDGALQHRSKGFFSVTGVRDSHGERLMLYQPQGAINGMLTRRVDGERQFLFQARAEPGNVGEVQFGPTFGPTWQQYPGDAEPPPSWLVPHLDDVWGETRESDEGGRFIDHRSVFRIARLSERAPAPPEEAGAWLRLSELKAFLESSTRCNIQLRVISSHLLGLR